MVSTCASSAGTVAPAPHAWSTSPPAVPRFLPLRDESRRV